MRRILSTISLVLIVLLASSAVAFGTADAPDSRHTQVSFADSANGYLAGFYFTSGGDPRGYVARTSDAGATWSSKTISNQALYGLGVADVNTAWAVTKTDLAYFFGFKSLSGGASWAGTTGYLEPSLPSSALPADIAAASGSEAVIVGGLQNDAVNGDPAAIWKTIDGGATWGRVYRGPLYSAANLGDPVPQTLASFAAVDRSGSTLYAVLREGEPGPGAIKDNYIMKSVDGGSTWTTCTPSPLPILRYNNSLGANIASASDISVVSGSVAWAAGPYGSNGQVFRTTDGTNWTKTTANPQVAVNGIDAIDANRALVVGEGGKVAYTVDGGATWVPGTFTGVNFNNLQSVSFMGSDSSKAVAVGDDQLIVLITLGMNGATPTLSGVVKRSADGNLSSTTTPIQQATSLALSVPATPAYASARVSGNLTASGAVVPGRTVAIEQSSNGSSWSAAASVATDANGVFAWAANPKVKTWYRAKFVGDTSYKASASAVVVAKPKVALGTPVAPKTMKAKKGYTVYGSLKPKHASGSKSSVRIYKYKWVSKKWKAYGYVKATNTNYNGYTRYKVKMSLPSKGTWKLVAKAPEDSLHTATTSAKYDKVKVK